MSIDTPTPFFVSAAAARTVFGWPAAVKAMQEAYGALHTEGSVPGRVVARDSGGWLRILPAMPPGRRYYGAKLMGMSTTAERPGAQYVTVLFDRETSAIAAFIDASIITGFRTAATSAAALDRIAPPGPATLAVLGSGLEASMHVRAFAAVRPLSAIALFSPTAAKREALAAQLADELGIPCHPVATAEAAVAGADIVLAAARSRGEQPILYGEWLADRATVVSIGSTVPEQREIDVSVVARCDLIVCDSVDEVSAETGDMIAATAAGIDFAAKTFSMNALMRGDLAARLAAARRPLFKSVGGGLQDVVIAEMILEAALREGCATALPIGFESKRRS